MMVECQDCKRFRMRKLVKSGTKVNFYSPGGKPWRSSNLCADCTVYRRKPKVLTVSKERSEDVAQYLWSAPMYHRDKGCPQCDGPMELSRYYACMNCKPEMKSDAFDEFMYMEMG